MPIPYKINRIAFLIFFFCTLAYGKEADNTPLSTAQEPPSIGNFSLPFSQQPGPFLSFGQNILAKNQTQAGCFINDFEGTQKRLVDISPSILHQITDNLSVFFNVPVAASYHEDNNHSAGLSDALLQFEYAFYNKQNSQFGDQATVVTNVILPTGSSQSNPAIGLGSPSFFLGGTFSRAYVDWFGFTSDGVTQTTSNQGIRPGDVFLYQFGLGRNILSLPSRWIFAGLIEADGQYTRRSKINGSIDPNSGGNVLYITPSLWFSSKKCILQLGIGWPIAQNLFGEQKENNYLLAANVNWTF